MKNLNIRGLTDIIVKQILILQFSHFLRELWLKRHYPSPLTPNGGHFPVLAKPNSIADESCVHYAEIQYLVKFKLNYSVSTKYYHELIQTSYPPTPG